jgi:hypothetical protein
MLLIPTKPVRPPIRTLLPFDRHMAILQIRYEPFGRLCLFQGRGSLRP